MEPTITLAPPETMVPEEETPVTPVPEPETATPEVVATVVPAEDGTIVFDFEDGAQGWIPRGEASASVTDDIANSGTHSLLVSNRTANWHGAAVDMSPLLKSGTMYEIGGHVRLAQGAPAADGEAVAAALRATGMTDLAGRLITGLSGGERQRALIAQTLAQQTPVLLLDEPLNNLDLNHQLEIMQLLSRLHGEGRTIAVVLHDLNIAAQYCHELVLLDRGRLAAQGTPNDILDPKTILEVFKVRVAVHRQGPRPYLTPVWSRAPEDTRAVERRVHVIAGGGAASGLLEELVAHGFAPTIGIVSVFDSDYAVAERYELDVVSAPPFEPFPPEVVQEFDSLADEAEVIIVAPVFFGRGNLAPLRTALQACRAGKRVVLLTDPPIMERDLSGGEACALVSELVASGAIEAAGIAQAVEAASATPSQA